MKIVLIRWKDAVAEEAVRSPAAKAQLVELTEVGFLLDESAEAIVIGMEMHQDGTVEPGRWRLHIPKVAIIERRDIDTAINGKKRKPRSG